MEYQAARDAPRLTFLIIFGGTMSVLTIFGILGVIVLFWLCLLGYWKLANTQKSWMALLSELEESSQKLKESTAHYGNAVSMSLC